MTPPWSVASRYYRELINLLKYLLYLFIIRTPRCGPELSRASKQLPLNSSCNGHAECAGVQSDFISLRGSDRAYITCAFLRRLSRAAPSLFPGYGPRGHLRPFVFALFLPPFVKDSSIFCARGGALTLSNARGIPLWSFSKYIPFIKLMLHSFFASPHPRQD